MADNYTNLSPSMQAGDLSSATGTLAVANGGTNSSTALSNGFFLSSQSGAIKEQPGIYVVQPSAGGAGIQTALDAAAAAGGGTVQLVAGTYTVSSAIVFATDANGVVLQGIGDASVLSSTITGAGYVIDIINGSSTNKGPYNLSNITKGDTSITTSTHSNAANILANMTVIIQGTDADSNVWQEVNEVLTTGNGTSGVIALKNKCKRTLTSASIIKGIVNGRGNKIRNLKAVFASGAAHFMRADQQVGFELENLTLNGAGFSAQNAIDLSVYQSSVRNCRFLNWNVDEGPVVPGSPGRATYITGVNNRIEGCLFQNCGVDGVAHASAISFQSLWDSQIIGNTILNTNGYGIYSTSSDVKRGILIANNNVSGSKNDGILIDGSSVTSELEILNNDLSYNGLGAVSGCGMKVLGAYLNIVGNVCNKNLDEGIWVDTGSDQIAITGNFCRGNSDCGIISKATNSTISGNTCESHSADAGIFVSGANDSVITGNNCGNNKYGIYISGTTSDVIASGNAARSCATKALLIDNGCSNVLSSGNNYRGGTVTLGSGTNINSINDLT